MKRFAMVALLCFSGLALRAQTVMPADSGHFTINQGDRPVGHSGFSIQPVKQGQIASAAAYQVTSHGSLKIENTTYSFSATGSLDKQLAILQENLSGTVDGSAVTFEVHPSGANFAIAISADGKDYHNSLRRPAQSVFFPDFDLASYEILLNLAARHPGAPISALIPKQTGILSTATLASQADVQGTSNGAHLTLHHSSLTIGSVVSELYYSSTNRIFEVDIPGQTLAVVRDNFQLQPPPPPPPNTQSQPNNATPPAQPQP